MTTETVHTASCARQTCSWRYEGPDARDRADEHRTEQHHPVIVGTALIETIRLEPEDTAAQLVLRAAADHLENARTHSWSGEGRRVSGWQSAARELRRLADTHIDYPEGA